MQKRALAIHDLSCVGRCSLTVALPILSAAGINTAALPTALLSTHTGGFTGFTHLDLSDQLLPIAAHLRTLSLHFNAIYSGYLADSAQVDAVLRIFDELGDEGTHLFVDPAFADQGRLYSLMPESMPAQMRRLCARARTIVPNLTEACFMLGRPYIANPTERELSDMMRQLAALGPENVIITGVTHGQNELGAAYLQKADGQVRMVMCSRYDCVFHGTGDVFASFLLAALLRPLPLSRAVALALDFTHSSIELTLEEGQDLRYGVQFERVLGAFLQALEA